ncbi:NAD(P)-dependent oxidoreductase [Sphingomonas sp. 1P06PA]|uniref:NAD(P)-dependent oxidoreductase n=1 Tax=Sphingomonas sp. 1P06PA TaxID=554121 RepID=UPI0039A51832
MAKVTFLGLGAMGAPIARHLAAAGHDVTVYNRTRAKADAWVAAYGGRAAPTPAAAAEDADAVLSCVGADGDLEAVTLRADGCFRAMRKGALYIDHTTVSARIARQLAVEGRDRGLLVVDAPVTGGQAGAEAGTLSIMCGGAEKAVSAARPFMQAYSQRIVHVGGAGSGQQTKMVNQICIAGAMQGVAEAFRFAQNADLDLEKVFEAISGGAGASWYLVNRWATMGEDRYDFGFAVDWMRKDLGLAIDEARANGAALPVTALSDQFYADIQAMGGGRQDISAIVRRLPRT